MRRVRLAVLAMAGVAVLLIGGGVAFALLSGGDEPPPPRLEREGVVADERGVPWRVGAGSFAG